MSKLNQGSTSYFIFCVTGFAEFEIAVCDLNH